MANPYKRVPPPRPLAQKWRRPVASDAIKICTICDRELLNPRILPCMHPFCEECLLLLLKGYERHKLLDRAFPCPTCGKRTPALFLGKVSSRWLNMFPKKQDIDVMTDSVLLVDEICQICSGQWTVSQAVKFCTFCVQFLCNTCCTDHKSSPENKLHTIVDYEVKQMKSTPVFNISKFTCKPHSNLRYSSFCELHNVFVCNTCKEGGHKSCRVSNNIIELSGNIIKAETKLGDVNNLRRDGRGKGKILYKMLQDLDDIQTKLQRFRDHKEQQYCSYVKQATITEQKTEAIDALKGKLEFDKTHLPHDVTYKTLKKVEGIVTHYANIFDLEDEKPIKAEINKNLADISKILSKPIFNIQDAKLKTDVTFVVQEEARYDKEIPSYHTCKKHARDCMDEDTLVKLAPLMKSVGVLRHDSLVGTVFRVGSKYVMTAAHVVRDIVDPERTGESDWQALEAKSVYVSFESPPRTDGQRFSILQYVPFLDDTLNVAVLEITNPGDLPPPLLLSMRDVTDLGIHSVAVIGYGHKGSQKKYIDNSCDIVDPDSTRAKQTLEWLRYILRHYRCNMLISKRDPTLLKWHMNELKDTTRIAVDCALEYRAHGAPGFAFPDDESYAEVMAVLNNSIPDCFSELPAKAQADYKDFRFESASKMSSIYDKMMVETRVIADDIFVRAKDYYGMKSS